MRPDRTYRDPGIAVLATVVPGSDGDAAAILQPRFSLPRVAIRRPSLEISSPIIATIALAAIFTGCCALVLVTTAEPTWIVPASGAGFPTWMAGPLHGLGAGLLNAVVPRGGQNYYAMSDAFSGLMIAMTVAYGIALAGWRTLSMRTIAIAVVALYAVLLLGPPVQLNDVFNYLGYARLGALHGLNPYTHVMLGEQHDPVFLWTSWRNLSSPYGELFTLLTYPLALVSLPLAYWILKSVTVLLALTFVWLVYRVARQLGRDGRLAVLLVAINPLVLMYEVGGFHNDPFMLVPAMGAISLLLARRYKLAGALLMVAISVKFTMVLLLPFLLLAAPGMRHRIQLLIGSALAAVPLVLVSVLAFGLSLPNLSDQSRLITPYSILNLSGLALGLGGAAPALIVLAAVALVGAVAFAARRVLQDRGDWLTAAGWCTLGLLASLSWLMPWYVIWVLPLAAVVASDRLRRATLVLTVFLVVTFLPLTGTVLSQLNVNPMSSSVGQKSSALEQHLAS
jgi:Glycosyltransferase family 87